MLEIYIMLLIILRFILLKKVKKISIYKGRAFSAYE